MKYDHYVTLFQPGARHGTDHLVREKDGDDVVTCCGLELRHTGSRLGNSRQVFVSSLTENTSIGTNICGNCPWEEVKNE